MSDCLPKTVDGLPRRVRIDLATEPELAIRKAIHLVESLGASKDLTDSVVFLGKALDSLSNHLETAELPKKNRPICPECGKATIVLFTPPKPGIVGTPEGYRLIGTPDYIDWDRAHLYCCNGSTNCKYEAPLRGPILSTP